MRARTIREGSVGLLILVGIGLFGGLLLWLRGFNPTNRPYQLIAEFDDTTGVQVGTMVLYRGVPVGRVTAVTAGSNSVDVAIEITQKDLRMPNQVRVETVESGLIGEMSIEITPLVELASSAADQSPVAKGCDSSVILCSGDRLAGVTGPSYEEFLRSASELTKLYADPELLDQLKTVLETVSETTADAGELAQEAIDIARVARVEIGPLSTSAKTAADSATRAAQQVEGAAQEFTLTATDINSLIGENRGTLVDTLGNVQAASRQLRSAADVLGPTLQSGELIGGLEVLITNASAASEDLQAITSSLNTPANLVLLQQTLESAREALASAQKVMADVDEITGDPEVRNQLRNLINGLGDLVSSTQSLEQQSEVARALVPLSEKIGEPLAQPTNTPGEGPAVGSVETQSEISVAVEAGSSARSIRQNPDASDSKPTLFFDGERYVVRFSQAESKQILKRK